MFGLGIYRKGKVELYKELNEGDKKVIQKLQTDIMQFEETQDLINYIKKIKDESIINIVENNGKFYALTKRVNEDSIIITMKNPYSREYPDVYATLEREVKRDEIGDYFFVNKRVYIEGIQAIDKREGNGRVLIEALISYAKEHQFKLIAGKMTDDDKKKTPGLPKFYKEMGFAVNGTESYFEMKL